MSMNTGEEQVREIIADQAGEWLVAHQARPLDAAERHAFHAWLTTSPVHIEEYLGVAALARHLPVAADDPQMPLESILERVRAESGGVARLEGTSPSRVERAEPRPGHRWAWVAVTAAVAALGFALLWWNGDRVTPERYATRHGELRSWRLSDQSMLRLNTDTSVTVRYSRSERLVELDRGEALFEVAHEAHRPFRVVAGTASALAVGTTFSVHREAGSTLVTVLQGRVVVSATGTSGAMATLAAGEQVRVADGQPPGRVTTAPVERSTAWLRRQIVFEREPLALVAAEFNRYSPLPIEIETPTLRALTVSGIFSVDDTETFLDFLRTFPGVTVQATAGSIRVFQVPPTTPSQHRVSPRS
jgi:transmembrane sensor